ncbi:MAG: hypothetical protein HY200_01115 [Nitrospirae bacterium]|nr:hypothetical protein [Nitrospirota bacterium]
MCPAEENMNQGIASGKKGMENLVTCPKCQFVYDIRYLSESCRFDEEAGYLCMNCSAIL